VNKKKKNIFLLLILLFCSSLLVTLRAGSIGSASYSDSIPSGGFTDTIYSDLDSSKIITTNQWWSSLLFHKFSQNIFAFPLNYKVSRYFLDQNSSDGLVLGSPDQIESNSGGVYAPFKNHLLIGATIVDSSSNILSSNVKVKDYSDWTVTGIWTDKTNSANNFKATFGQGLIFTYFKFTSNLNAKISVPFEWAKGTFYVYNYNDSNHQATNFTHAIYGSCRKIITDRFLIQVAGDFDGNVSTWEKNYYGVYLPEGTTVYLTNYNTNGEYGYKSIIIEFSGTERYMSIALLKQYNQPNNISNTTSQLTENLGILNNFYYSAYNFVTNTKIEYEVDEENGKVNNKYSFTLDKVRTIDNQNNGTLFALFPHHYDSDSNLTGASIYSGIEYNTLRGKLKLYSGTYFENTLNFNGIIPFFDDKGLTDDKKAILNTYLNSYNVSSDLLSDNLYFYGKQANNIANLIRIADKVGNQTKKQALIDSLKSSLINWFTNSGSQYFYYNQNIKSLISYPHKDFKAENMNDHHFHYGYVIYASAILAYYDSSFKENYGGFVEYLIKDFANYDRDNTSSLKFPFLRNFSIYEGHSFANGFAHYSDSDDNRDYGNDQESSSEAMNAWAGIYLWGLLNNKDDYKNLGIFGYTTEYSSIRKYWYDLDDDIYSSSYNKKSIGILFGGKVVYDVWFNASSKANYLNEFVFGIQMLPLNPTSLYLGYDENYLYENYNSFMLLNSNQDPKTWKDIFWKYLAMFNSGIAMNKMVLNLDNIIYESSNKPYFYYWVNFFNSFGKVDTSIYANLSSAVVFNKDGIKTYFVFNPTSLQKTVVFKSRSTNSTLGYYNVPAKTLVSFNKLIDNPVAPTPVKEVFQGAILGIDINLQKNTGTVYANWNGVLSEATGVERYSVSISTSVGGAEILDWTDVWDTNFSKSGLTLENDKTYYINVKSKNFVGVESEITTSKGFKLTSNNIPLLKYIHHGSSALEDLEFTKYLSGLNALWSYDNATSYQYAFSKSSNTEPTVWSETTNESVYVSQSLENKTTYYLYIKAKNGSYEGGTIRSRGVYVYNETPKVYISFDKSEPLSYGKKNLTLFVDNEISIKDNYKLFYNFETSVSTFTAKFTKSSFNTLKAEIPINFNQRDTYIKFFSLVIEDLAGNATNILSSKTKFTIDTSLNINEDTTLLSDDGVEIFIPAGTFDEKVIIDVQDKTKSENNIYNANKNIKDDNVQIFANNYSVYKEFTAKSKNTNKLIEKFNNDIQIKIPYKDTNKDRVIDNSKVNVNQVSVFYLNETDSVWEPVKKVDIDYINNKMIAQVSHFSIYSLLQISSFSNLNSVIVYPNPFYPKKDSKVKIDKLPNIYDSIDIWIYDITGRLIKKLDKNNIEKNSDGNSIIWDGRSSKGEKVASGIYIILIKTNYGTKKEKLAILW
jgi:endoglucanase Acf2